MKYTEHPERSWEFAAGKVLSTMGCDGPFKGPLPAAKYRDMYDKGMYDALARKAMREINQGDPGKWTVDYQVELLASKKHDYGHENIHRFGDQGVLVRLWDKISRYENLIKRGKTPANESVEDTLKDMIGYCAIYQMLVNGTFNHKLSEDMK